MNLPPTTDTDTIELWFKSQCDHLWEHQNGLKLETTDNPGWLMMIDITADESKVSVFSDHLKKQWQANCAFKHSKLEIYAESLNNCLAATAYILSSRCLK